jgi:hypothetical protein
MNEYKNVMHANMGMKWHIAQVAKCVVLCITLLPKSGCTTTGPKEI